MIRKISEAGAVLSFQLHKNERRLFRLCTSLCLGKNCVSFEEFFATKTKPITFVSGHTASTHHRKNFSYVSGNCIELSLA